MGILKPSSAGSVIFVIFRIKFVPFAVSFTSLNFYSEILGVKFINTVLIWLRDLT